VNKDHRSDARDTEPNPAEVWRIIFAWIADPTHANAITAVATFVICLTGIFYTIYSGLQWKAADKAAGAAKSAAETADKALHISERAYVVAGLPSMNMTTDVVTLPIVNTGHIPSGDVRAIIHEATVVVIPDSPINHPIEAHWKHYTLESVPTSGETLNFNISAPNVDVAQLKSGHQQVLIVGVISYNDGFRDDPDQQWAFCFGNAVTPQTKDLQWVVCNSSLYLAQAIATDHYPQNESK
jgi:hypothetical protein